MLLAEDQHAVQKLAAQGADEPFADRIHTGSSDRCAQDPGASGLEDSVERGSEVRAVVAEQEPDVPEPFAEGKSEVAGLLDCPLPGGMFGDAAEVHPAGAVLSEHQDIQSLEQHGINVQEGDREDPGGLGCQELPPRRACAPRRRIDARGMQDLPTVDGATVMPSFASSPWIRRCPHSGFSFASRTTRRAMPGTVGGRPGFPRPLVSYFRPASLRCQASSVAGVIGKISVQRLRGMSRASAANHTRSPGSYRIRPTWRSSTAFSCRSTSSSASFARSLRSTRTARPSRRRTTR